MSQHSISNSLLNIMLVIAESALTLILKFDPNLRRAVYPLAKQNVTVCVRTYLPHTEFYATFTNKGILLDDELPRGRATVDVIINTYTHQLLNTFVNSDRVEIDKLTMRGDAQAVAQVRHFLVELSIINLFQSLIHIIRGKKENDSEKSDEQKDNKKKDEPDYKARYKEQRQQLDALSIRNRELEMTIKEVKSKQKFLLIALAVVTLVAIVALIGWMT